MAISLEWFQGVMVHHLMLQGMGPRLTGPIGSWGGLPAGARLHILLFRLALMIYAR